MLPGLDLEPIDLGRVGIVTTVLLGSFQEMFDAGLVPIVPSLARDADGGWLNVNADTAASAVAGTRRGQGHLPHRHAGRVARPREPQLAHPLSHRTRSATSSPAASSTAAWCRRSKPVLRRLEAGAKSALILDGRVPFSLLDVFLHDTFKGTAIVR